MNGGNSLRINSSLFRNYYTVKINVADCVCIFKIYLFFKHIYTHMHMWQGYVQVSTMEQLIPKTTDKKMCYSVSCVGTAEIFSKIINARHMLHTSVGNTRSQGPTKKHRNKAEITQQGNFFFTKRVLLHDPNQASWQAGSGWPRGFILTRW